MGLGALIAGAGYVAGEVKGRTSRAVSKTINQSIDITSGRVDVVELSKIALRYALYIGVLIILINGTRGIMMWMEQTTCASLTDLSFQGLLNTFIASAVQSSSGIDVGTIAQEAFCSTFEYTFSYHWAYEIEWALRCIFVWLLSFIVWGILYKWFMYLSDKMLRANKEIAKLKSLVFGLDIGGSTPEKEIDQRL